MLKINDIKIVKDSTVGSATRSKKYVIQGKDGLSAQESISISILYEY